MNNAILDNHKVIPIPDPEIVDSGGPLRLNVTDEEETTPITVLVRRGGDFRTAPDVPPRCGGHVPRYRGGDFR